MDSSPLDFTKINSNHKGIYFLSFAIAEHHLLNITQEVTFPAPDCHRPSQEIITSTEALCHIIITGSKHSTSLAV